ncbi:MAG TPA: FN3 associated domain-containing protein [Verrucomicrobiae bacterium]|nr:FN3 associated domain-containing protein [Verrucomicrobiae bacterium]
MKIRSLLMLVAAMALGAAVTAQTVDTAVVATLGLREPHSLAVDTNNYYYITDSANNRVVRYAPDSGLLTTLAGAPDFSPGYTDGLSIKVRFFDPKGIVATRGGLVVADYGNHVLRFVSFQGQVSTLAGQAGVQGGTDGQGTNALFNYPVGLALDDAGNIFIADSKNNSIRKMDSSNVVTTVVSGGLYEPSGVDIGDNGDIWVADTRNHAIKGYDATGKLYPERVIGSNSRFVSGAYDSEDGLGILFNNPRSVLWNTAGTGLIVGDTGNHTLRRVYYNTNFNVWTASTLAGQTGQPGFVNGTLTEAKFNSPIGVSRDLTSGAFLIVDSANNAIRQLQTTPPRPPVSDPKIGYVIFVESSPGGPLVSRLVEVTEATFNDDVIIEILGENGAELHYTYGVTPLDILQDNIPSPDRFSGQTPKFHYTDGLFPSQISQDNSLVIPPLPDLTIKAIGFSDGRRPSSVKRARFKFKVADPVVVGNNAASFVITNQTSAAQMFYTTDGSDPTEVLGANPNSVAYAGGKLSFTLGDSNLVFKIQAFKPGFAPSRIVTNIFSPTNFVANVISFGFESGEASSDFVGAAGQRFYAPVTLKLLPTQKMYTLQFNLTVGVNSPAAPPVLVGPSQPSLGFHTTLMKPIPGTGRFTPIPPALFTGFMPGFFTNSITVVDTNGVPYQTNYVFTNVVAGFSNLVVTNSTLPLIGVGWLERLTGTNLYDTIAQDLITFSQPHDTMFTSDKGKVVLGSFSFVVPPNATTNDTYRIQIGRPSATDNGIGTPGSSVFIDAPTKGSLGAGVVNALKVVGVGSRPYVVGDVAPFRWLNAGDFGDTNLLSDDVVQVFQSAVYHYDTPPPLSDLFDALDSSDGSLNNSLLILDSFAAINNIKSGDGSLNVDDVFVTFRRSLDPGLNWYARYWSNGVRQVAQVPNVFFGKPNGKGSKQVVGEALGALPKAVLGGVKPSVTFTAGDLVGQPGQTVTTPIYANVTGSLPLRVLLLNLDVQALDGSPNIATPVVFTPAPGLGAPTFQMSRSPGNYAATWLDDSIAGLSGSALVGTLQVTIPANATADSAYKVDFTRVSSSPNGLGLFEQRLTGGLVTLRDRSGSSWGDGIPDTWRLRYFGSISNLLSHAKSDADGDGLINRAEFQAGTDPVDIASKLSVAVQGAGGSQSGDVVLRWPTVAGKTYVVEASPTLFGSPWSVVATGISGTGGDVTYTDVTNGGASLFYRVRLAE